MNNETIRKLYQRVGKKVNGLAWEMFHVADYYNLADHVCELCEAINELDETETIWEIGHDADFTLDDLIIGLYYHYYYWSGSSATNSYRASSLLSTIYKPSPCQDHEPENEAQKSIFEALNEAAKSYQKYEQKLLAQGVRWP